MNKDLLEKIFLNYYEVVETGVFKDKKTGEIVKSELLFKDENTK